VSQSIGRSLVAMLRRNLRSLSSLPCLWPLQPRADETSTGIHSNDAAAADQKQPLSEPADHALAVTSAATPDVDLSELDEFAPPKAPNASVVSPDGSVLNDLNRSVSSPSADESKQPADNPSSPVMAQVSAEFWDEVSRLRAKQLLFVSRTASHPVFLLPLQEQASEVVFCTVDLLRLLQQFAYQTSTCSATDLGLLITMMDQRPRTPPSPPKPTGMSGIDTAESIAPCRGNSSVVPVFAELPSIVQVEVIRLLRSELLHHSPDRIRLVRSSAGPSSFEDGYGASSICTVMLALLGSTEPTLNMFEYLFEAAHSASQV